MGGLQACNIIIENLAGDRAFCMLDGHLAATWMCYCMCFGATCYGPTVRPANCKLAGPSGTTVSLRELGRTFSSGQSKAARGSPSILQAPAKSAACSLQLAVLSRRLILAELQCWWCLHYAGNIAHWLEPPMCCSAMNAFGKHVSTTPRSAIGVSLSVLTGVVESGGLPSPKEGGRNTK